MVADITGDVDGRHDPYHWGDRLRVMARRRRRLVLIGVDATLLGVAYAVMALLRYENQAVPWSQVALVAAFAVVIHVGLSWGMKINRGRALIGSTEETILLGSVAVVTVVLVSVVNVMLLNHLIARTVPPAAGFVAVALMVMARAVWRSLAASRGWRRNSEGNRTLVVGAGEAGRQLLGSMLGSADSPYMPVGLLDDDPWKRHLRHFGVPVRGTIAALAEVAVQQDVDTVVVAIPSAPGTLVKAIDEQCVGLDVEVKVLPPVEEIFGPRVSIQDVRDIDVADVLGRGAIETDVASIAHYLAGKRVLVTGAGGSIGSELARQIARWEPGELMLLDRDESGLHGVQLSLHGRAMLDSPEVLLCDIRDRETLERIFDERRPEVVFHAAALKHLTVLEQYPAEAMKTNVLGTVNVLEAARRVGVERFVNISTDKAADPTSVLGFSKRVAERVTANYADGVGGAYLSVRFGNVLGSRGSMLTTFASQIAQGGPVTVTHPDVTRYFMTVSEAVQLVLQAGAIGNDGEVLILDMGDPVRIDDVARELIRQSGQHVDIVYTGLREGEKLDEILRSSVERDHRPHHDLISHVNVPAMTTAFLIDARMPTDSGAAKTLLAEWCGVDVKQMSRTNGASEVATVMVNNQER